VHVRPPAYAYRTGPLHTQFSLLTTNLFTDAHRYITFVFFIEQHAPPGVEPQANTVPDSPDMFRRQAPPSPAAAAPAETLLLSSAHECSLHASVLALLSHELAPPTGTPSPAMLTRYLRARSHSPPAAAAMLSKTLAYRAANPCSVCAHCVARPRTHSFFPIGPSVSGEPIAYSNYHAESTDPADNCSHMEFAMNALFGGNDDSLARMTWVMDMVGFGRKHMSPTIAKSVLGLFADHHPERLRCAVVYDAPAVFSALFSAVKLFVDPVTVRKVVFIKHCAPVEEKVAAFESIGVAGESLAKLMREIKDARDPVVAKEYNWWERPPVAPTPHFGRQICDAAADRIDSETQF
jgi:CRAL/TRIO domain